MRKRVLGAMVGAALVAVPLTSAGAAAQTVPPGKGTATATATVLRVQLGADGSLLDVRLLGDDSASKNGPGDTNAALSPLTVSSAVVPALSVTVPPVQTSSTGGADSEELAPALPATPAAVGTLAGTLTSVVDPDGAARSSIEATLSNLGLAGGLVTAPSAALRLGTDARGTAAEATRTITVPELVVLDLGAVLDGLGRPLAGLPVATLVGLLGQLGLTLPVGTGALDAAALGTTIGQLNTAIDQVTAVGTGALGTVCSVVDGAIGTLPGGLGAIPGLVGSLPVPSVPAVPGVPTAPAVPAVPTSCADAAATATTILAQLRGTLAGLLSSLLSLLDGAALLSVKDVSVGVVAKATDAVGTSIADVTAKVGEVTVGATPLPLLSGLDLGAGVEAINALAGTLGTAVNGVLATVDPLLANVVDVDLLQITKDIRTEGADTVAEAGVVALKATITPPLGLVAAAVDQSNVGTAITGLGGTVPALSTGTAGLESALGAEALSAPATVTVADLGSASRFAPGVATQVASAPGGTLPRTGAETDRMVELAAALFVAGLSLLVLVVRRRPAAL